MIEQNFMDKLLDGVEVEWKPLGKVADYEQPTKYLVKSTNYNDEFNIPVLTAGKTFILGYTDETEGVYEASKQPVIIFDDFTTANKWVDFDFKAKSSAMKMIKSSDENEALLKYIYYWMNTLSEDQTDTDHKRQWISNYANKIIPIPPLPVQAEIVRILDTFTEQLTAELTAELTARKKQYNYYRDKLLTFEDGQVEWKTLGEVATFSQGLQVDVSNQFTEKQENFVRFLRIVDFVKDDEIPRYIKDPGQRYIKKDGELVMIRYGASAAGKVFLNYSGAIANNMFKINLINEKITAKFLHTYLSLPQIYNNLNSNAGASTMPAITFGQIGAVPIPIPSLTEQERIVSILDKFYDLTSSITEGLPREIELRQKQYEYYRNMLLSFPKE